MNYLTLPAHIDTGFSGGVRLPEELPKQDIQFLRLTGDHVGPWMREGKKGEQVFDQYSLLFGILNEKRIPIMVTSENVFFAGKEYALLGLDFLRECNGEIKVHGGSQVFTFSVKETESSL